MNPAAPIILATRPSALARWQTEAVRQALSQAWPELEFETLVIETQGDRTLDRPLPEIGGKGLFTQELEAALLSGKADLAVHSLKDLPIGGQSGMITGAFLERGEVRDVLAAPVVRSLDHLAAGAIVGTSSPRRQAQILAVRPDLDLRPIRGNVETRLRKVLRGEYEAAIMAAAGLQRLGLEKYISIFLPLEIMLPSPGQGTIAVQCREDDSRILRLLKTIDHTPTRMAAQAERVFLSSLGGGCSAPVGAYARWSNGQLYLEGVVASLDGQTVIRVEGRGEDPEALGQALAEQGISRGAAEVMANV